MARPKRDTVDYFPHDAHASRDSATLKVLESHFKNDGYAFWFKLLEKLASTDGHFLDLNDPRRRTLFVAESNVNENQAVEMLVLLVEMQAIDKDLWEQRKVIWCQHLIDNVAEAYQNRKRPLPEKPQLYLRLNPASESNITTPDNLITTPNNSITKTDNPQRILKETILDDTILDETKEVSSIKLNKTTLEDVLDAFRKNILLDDQATIPEDMQEELTGACNRYSPEWVYDAIKEAVLRNVLNWPYIIGVLRKWQRYGKGAKFPP